MKKLEIILTGAGLILIVSAHIMLKSLPHLSFTLFILSAVCCLCEMVVTFLRKRVVEPQKEKDLLRRQTEQAARIINAYKNDDTIIITGLHGIVKDGDTYDPRRG